MNCGAFSMQDHPVTPKDHHPPAFPIVSISEDHLYYHVLKTRGNGSGGKSMSILLSCTSYI